MINFIKERDKIKIYYNDMFSLRQEFSVKDENARFKYRHNPKFSSDRIYAITPSGSFDPGLFYNVYDYVKQNSDDNIIIDDDVYDVIRPEIKTDVSNNLHISLRDYQIDCVKNCLNFGRGTVKLGTGGGKTLIMSSLLQSIYKYNPEFKTLIIVPDLGLVSQTYENFKEYKVEFTFGKWTSSDKLNVSDNCVIANIGILQSRFNDNDWIKYVDYLLIDECHKIRKGSKITKLINKIKTYNKFGFTGTFPDNKPDEWNIIGKIGPVVYSKDSFDLRKNSFLTNAKVNIINIKYKNQPYYSPLQDNYRSELDFIYHNSYRNKLIKNIVEKYNQNILILVNHLDHGDTLYNKLKHELVNKKVFFVKGEMAVDEREQVKQTMEKNNNIVCIAMTSIFSTGINIKNLPIIMFAAGGKSFIRTIQSIGRGLRLHENKNKLIIIDILDTLRYGQRHGTRRKEIYKIENIEYAEGEVVEN